MSLKPFHKGAPGLLFGMCLMLLWLLVVSGCSSARRFALKPVAVEPPESYSTEVDFAGAGELDGWADTFADRELARLISEALSGNLSLRLALSRISAARLAAEDAASERRPSLSAGIQTNRSRSVSESDGKTHSETGSTHGLSLDLSWEADLWGRLAESADAADAELQATAADLRAARLSIAGRTARAWFDLTAARLQAELAREVEESYSRSRKILERRYRTGLNTALDLNLVKSSEVEARSQRLLAEQTAAARSRSLEILLGRYPEGGIEGGKKLEPLRNPVPTGLPSDLLNRRPDIVSARLKVLAADLRTGASEKARLPKITLTAGSGISSGELKNLVRADYLFWNLVGGLTQPLFDSGRRKRAVETAENAAEQAWIDYSNITLSAFREVETALDAESRLGAREENLRIALAVATAADKQAWRQYLAGDTEIITVLDSRRRVLDARTRLVHVGAERLRNRVDLYLALGASPFPPEDKETPAT